MFASPETSRRRLKASVVSMVYVSAIGLLTKRDDPILLIVGLHHFGIITSPVQVRDSELRYHADPLVFIVHPVLHSRPNNIVIRQQLQKLRRTPHRHALMDDVRGERCPKRRQARCPPPKTQTSAANCSRRSYIRSTSSCRGAARVRPVVSSPSSAFKEYTINSGYNSGRASSRSSSAALTSAMVRSIAVGAAHIHTSVGGNVLGSTPQEPRSRAKQSPRPFWRHLWQTYPCARPASYIRRFSQAIGFACNCRVLSAGLPPSPPGQQRAL
jgi:hypothetical protein